MKVIALRSFSAGLDTSASTLDGPRLKRRYAHIGMFAGKEYDVKKETADQWISWGWVKPAKDQKKAEVKTKGAKEETPAE